MLIDETEIIVRGGHGGAGLISFGKMRYSGPDGGNGGKGGDLYVLSSSDLTLLNQFSSQKEFSAENGHPGGKNKRTGKNGSDFVLNLPVGSILVDKNTGETILELKTPNEKHLICMGGKGGKGNWEFRSPRRTTPKIAQPGLPGDELELKIILKLIADVGLIGLPNAGKSSLLNELTNANVKIGAYAFTTLSPNLAVLDKKIIADIPGLIEGASTGRGLGISFLKHIEKVKILLHCVAADTENAVRDYETVRRELESYNKELAKKKEIILLTKSDLIEKNDKKSFQKVLSNFPSKPLLVSIHDFDSINKLRDIISNY
jgi:GTPase